MDKHKKMGSGHCYWWLLATGYFGNTFGIGFQSFKIKSSDIGFFESIRILLFLLGFFTICVTQQRRRWWTDRKPLVQFS